MDDETAAKYVLLDFELITFVAIAMGLLVYAIAKRWRRDPLADGLEQEDYDGFDLVLMFFPALLFLITPLVEVFSPEKPIGEAESTGKLDASTMDLLVLLLSIGFFAFVWVMTFGLLAWVRNRRVSELFGLKRLGPVRVILYSLIGGALSLVICGEYVGGFVDQFFDGVFGKLEMQEPVRMLREAESSVHLFFSILMACVAAPFAEEFLFRGYIYGALRQFTHPVFAAIAVGALFAVAHNNLPALLPLWVFSLLLTMAYEWTRCLWVAVGMHACFNAISIVMMLSSAPTAE